MTEIPAGFVPSADHVRAFELVSIDTADGLFRFALGADGIFRDVDGNEWFGSSMFSMSATEMVIGGAAPEATLQFSYIPDPGFPDPIKEMKARGLEYVEGREVRLYLQPFRTLEELYAPALPPQLITTRLARKLQFGKAGAEERSIALTMESVNEDRRAARRIQMDERGHAQLIGETNISLRYRPTVDFEEEPMFG